MATRLGDLVRHLPSRMRLEGTAKQSIEIARHRLVITGVLFALAFAVVALRLVDVTILKEGHEPRMARLPSSELQTDRADIVDRNGVLLATSLATGSLYANPKLVLDANEAATKLARVLPGLNEKETAAKLSSDRSFVWLRRSLSSTRSTASASPACSSSARSAASIRTARSPRMSSASPTSTSAAWPA